MVAIGDKLLGGVRGQNILGGSPRIHNKCTCVYMYTCMHVEYSMVGKLAPCSEISCYTVSWSGRGPGRMGNYTCSTMGRYGG